MAYQPTTWVNNAAPAINAENLNHIENGIASVDSALDALNTIAVTTANVGNQTVNAASYAAIIGQPTEYVLRNAAFNTADTTPDSNGDISWTYA